MIRGRPRTFDEAEALDVALGVFWRHGYEGASVTKICEAVGVNPPSLYAAFGDKRAMFRKVVERYLERHAVYIHRAIGQTSSKEVARHALSGAIAMISEPGTGDGCLLVHGALATGPSSDEVRQELASTRQRAEAAICARFEQAPDLPEGTEPRALADYLMAVIWGMSVQAAGGASSEQLEAVAAVAMRIWE